jgi:HEPN domain-containing protein
MTPIALNHPDLKQAAQELERRVGDYTRMRYPRPVFYPRTPSDLYSEDDANNTCRHHISFTFNVMQYDYLLDMKCLPI